MKSPGHQQWPEHRVREQHMNQRLRVAANGQIVAESSDVIRVVEDGHPVRYYFPRSDVRMDGMERSVTTSQCPFKGTAHYFNLRLDGATIPDAVWSYEEPFEEHRELRERVAFYDDRVPAIQIAAMP